MGFGERIRQRAAEMDLNAADLARAAGIKKQSMTGYWNGERFCGSEKLFALSDALKVDARWLISGTGADRSSQLVDIDDADWESVPFFDFRDITDEGKGPAVYWTPFRKDWLNRTLGRWTELYLVQLLSGYESRDGASDLDAGDLVFCTEITPAELVDGNVCIFRREGALKVARYSVRRPDRDEGDVVMPEEISNEEFVPVCRILGRFAQRI